MGYYSEVHIAVAFQNEADLKEVVAVYAMDPRVQKHELLKDWEVMKDNVLYLHYDYTKWYDSFEEVQGCEYLMQLVETFHEERDMAFAYRFIRIGEEEPDIERNEQHGGDDGELIQMLWDRMQVVRTVEVNFS
jgi:hypothetical protein